MKYRVKFADNTLSPRFNTWYAALRASAHHNMNVYNGSIKSVKAVDVVLEDGSPVPTED